MSPPDERLREVLLAEVALEQGAIDAAAAVAALARFEATGRPSVLSALAPDRRAGIESEVDRALRAAGGDPRTAILRRGGIDRRLLAAAPAIAEAGAPARAPLRPLDPERYVDFQPLGEGGMGVVYLVLDTELNRRVAFKMIRPATPGADPLDATPFSEDPEIRARFLQEAWATGGLEHPGIVPVYELGVTPRGVPYYTMRYVRGRRTLEQAIAQAASLEARLALLEPYLRVCDAIAYAHSRGVVHRDLKPANIALGEFGEAVVLDWGLSKVREQPDAAETRWHERFERLRAMERIDTLTYTAGTPGYMPPEAAIRGMAEADHRVDVYGLGAILYRILTGRVPYECRTFGEFVERLLGGPPAPPESIEPAVPARLSAVALRAMASRPEERFESVDALAREVRAWQRETAAEKEALALRREAESALATATGLRDDALLTQLDRVIALASRAEELHPAGAQQLVARARAMRAGAVEAAARAARGRALRRGGVAALVAVAALAVGAALLVEERRAEAEAARLREAEQRGRAERERERAEEAGRREREERGRAEELANFMLFELRDGLQPIGRLDLLGKVARRSLEYYKSLPAERVDDLAWRRRSAALENVGDVLLAMGDVAGALESHEESLAIARRLLASRPGDTTCRRDVSVALHGVGDTLRQTGDLAGALARYEEALAVRRALLADAPDPVKARRDVTVSLSRVAEARAGTGDPEGALAHLRESLATLRALEAEGHAFPRDVAYDLQEVGDLLLARGDLAGARDAFAESLAIRRRLVEAEPANQSLQSDLVIGLTRVADVTRATGDLEGALSGYGEALALLRRLAERDAKNARRRREITVALNRIGETLRAKGDAAGALERFRESLAVRRALADQDPRNARWRRDVAVNLDLVADALKALRRVDEALVHAREALAIHRDLGERDPANTAWRRDVGQSLTLLGDTLRLAGLHGAALAAYDEAAAVARELLARDPSNADWRDDAAAALGGAGLALLALEDLASAEARLAESLRLRRALVEKAPENLARARELAVSLERSAVARLAAGDADGALASLLEADAVRRRLVEKNPANEEWRVDLGSGRLRTAAALLAKGDRARAEATLAEAERLGEGGGARAAELRAGAAELRATLRFVAGEAAPASPADHLALARAFSTAGRPEEATPCFEAAFADAVLRAPNLYAAACVAACVEGAGARALAWLEEELAARAAAVERAAAEAAAAPGEVAAARLEDARAVLALRREQVRAGDARLAPLRALPAFAALLR